MTRVRIPFPDFTMLIPIAPSLILGAGGMLLNLFVLPTVLDDEAAVPRAQSVPTTVALAAMTYAYATLGLVVPALATAIGAVLWAVVAAIRAK